MDEIRKDIIGYEGKYQVSNFGNIKSLLYGREKILNSGCTKEGYSSVGLNRKSMYVHRLVAQAFIPNPKNKPQVNHINGNRNDNRIENLERVTNGENQLHSFINLGRRSGRLGCKGKLYDHINQYSLDGVFIKKWNRLTDIKIEMNINEDGVYNCCAGFSKTSSGYKWCFGF